MVSGHACLPRPVAESSTHVVPKAVSAWLCKLTRVVCNPANAALTALTGATRIRQTRRLVPLTFDPPTKGRPLVMQPSIVAGFPRSAKLTQAAEFDQVFRRPEFKKHYQALRIRARTNRMHGARLGLVVGKRQVPKAHDRNRLKRICRETFRQLRQELPDVDIVVQVLSNQGNKTIALQMQAGLLEVSTHFTHGDYKT